MDDFQHQVLFILAHSLPGDVFSYGELAKLAGKSNYARMVAKILKNLPNNTQIPWYRVVNSQKRISFSEGSDGYERQKALLENDGWVIVGQRLIAKETP